MTDSYHFESVAKFRIGGVYRDGTGEAIRLLRPWSDDKEFAIGEYLTGHEAFSGAGALSLVNGRYLYGEEGDILALIPGELVQRDGQWVAADSIGPFPSGATLKVAGDKIVGRVEAKLVTTGGNSYVPSMGGSMTVYCVGGGGGGGGSGSPIQRAPLPNSDEWRGIGHKAHDTFGPDFIVTKGAEPTSPLYDSPTTDSAYPAIAGLLRG